jgi:hypothetical protein
MSAIFITKSLQTMVKGPSRRRLWMYTEKKIVDVQREEDCGCTTRRRLWMYTEKKIILLLLYLAYQQKVGI